MHLRPGRFDAASSVFILIMLMVTCDSQYV
jgi:hypothetical protein